MMTRHVAIIIVTYKTAQLTIECLSSIQTQRDQPGLLVTATVVDNSSEDYETIDRAVQANGWSDWVQLTRPEKNGGFAYGNNVGVKVARKAYDPDYIHLLNPDTVLREGAIASLVQFLEAHKEAGIAGSSFENLDGSVWPFAFRFPTILSEIEEGLQLGLVSRLIDRWVVARTMGKIAEQVDWVPGASMMVRSTTFDAVGGLDDHYFLYFEETDFCFRAKQLGLQTWYVPASRVMHIAGQSTKVTEREAQARRLPPYWFESRRRFFVMSYGLPYAILADVGAVLARTGGALKRFCLRQRTGGVPHYIRDVLQHSVLWPHNRQRLRPT
jgi:GT2 family glycosyltransferase